MSKKKRIISDFWLTSGCARVFLAFASSSNVIGDVNGVELIFEEFVAQMHSLFAALAVYRNRVWIEKTRDAHDQVMLFENGACDR